MSQRWKTAEEDLVEVVEQLVASIAQLEENLEAERKAFDDMKRLAEYLYMRVDLQEYADEYIAERHPDFIKTATKLKAKIHHRHRNPARDEAIKAAVLKGK